MLADLYSVFPEERFHNPGQALKLARKAVELDRPGTEAQVAWQSLGWAQYRMGDWKGCIQTVGEHGEDGGFFQAMAHWQLGDKAKARALFHRADKWLVGYEERWKEYQKHHHVYPDPAMLRRMRAEAASLLGLKKPGSGRTSESTPKTGTESK